MALAPFFGRNNNGSGSIWDPFSHFGGGSMFDPSEFFSREGGFSGRTRVDWVETPESHVLKADLPGLKKEEIKVEVVDGRTLSISGERSQEKREETDSWRCLERSHGKFYRQFGMPENAKMDEIGAKVEDGVLTVTVPKVHNTAPRARTIDIK